MVVVPFPRVEQVGTVTARRPAAIKRRDPRPYPGSQRGIGSRPLPRRKLDPPSEAGMGWPVGPLEISVTARESGSVVVLAGDAALASVTCLDQALTVQLSGRTARLRIDTSDLRFADSVAIRAQSLPAGELAALVDSGRAVRPSDRVVRRRGCHHRRDADRSDQRAAIRSRTAPDDRRVEVELRRFIVNVAAGDSSQDSDRRRREHDSDPAAASGRQDAGPSRRGPGNHDPGRNPPRA
jgi:hypothetical protein